MKPKRRVILTVFILIILVLHGFHLGFVISETHWLFKVRGPGIVLVAVFALLHLLTGIPSFLMNLVLSEPDELFDEEPFTSRHVSLRATSIFITYVLFSCFIFPFRWLRQRKSKYLIEHDEFDTHFVRIMYMIFACLNGVYALFVAIGILFVKQHSLLKPDYYLLALCVFIFTLGIIMIIDAGKLLRRTGSDDE